MQLSAERRKAAIRFAREELELTHAQSAPTPRGLRPALGDTEDSLGRLRGAKLTQHRGMPLEQHIEVANRICLRVVGHHSPTLKHCKNIASTMFLQCSCIASA